MKNQAAGTAFGPMVIVAIEQFYPEEKRLISDDLAYQFLPQFLKKIVRLTRFSAIRNWMMKATERKSPGVWAGILCRKRYIDLKLADALNAGIDVVVNLGAGMDTRAYRLPELKTKQVFEVDLPGNIAYKQAMLEMLFGGIPAHTTLVPVDFDNEELGSVLALHGYQTGQKSFFIWEGVTQYLTEAGVRKTFYSLAKAGAGSRLVFTYVRKDFIDGIALYGLDNMHRQVRIKSQLWRFGLAPEQVAAFLQEYGWKEAEQASCRELSALYMQSDNRFPHVTAPAMEIERLVLAEKL